VFNSADAGVSLRGHFAGELEDAEEKTGSHYYPGRYGSWHVGVYNGSGYHASEENNNKALEGRLTWRPLPDVIPGLQLSYFGIYGEGNDKDNPAGDWPDYVVNMGMLSYENPWLILTGQYFTTEGSAKGTWVDASGHALETAGYSFFGNLKLPVLDAQYQVGQGLRVRGEVAKRPVLPVHPLRILQLLSSSINNHPAVFCKVYSVEEW